MFFVSFFFFFNAKLRGGGKSLAAFSLWEKSLWDSLLNVICSVQDLKHKDGKKQ